MGDFGLEYEAIEAAALLDRTICHKAKVVINLNFYTNCVTHPLTSLLFSEDFHSHRFIHCRGVKLINFQQRG